MKHNLVMLAALFLAFPAGAEAGDMEDIVAAIEKRWTDTAKKQIDADASNPAGSWLATSQGGLWRVSVPRRGCGHDYRFTKYPGFSANAHQRSDHGFRKRCGLCNILPCRQYHDRR